MPAIIRKVNVSWSIVQGMSYFRPNWRISVLHHPDIPLTVPQATLILSCDLDKAAVPNSAVDLGDIDWIVSIELNEAQRQQWVECGKFSEMERELYIEATTTNIILQLTLHYTTLDFITSHRITYILKSQTVLLLTNQTSCWRCTHPTMCLDFPCLIPHPAPKKTFCHPLT